MNSPSMVTEHAILMVKPGEQAAFAQARPLISSTPGFVELSLSRSLESPDHYLLLVAWRSLEDHTVGFRGSAEFQQWRELLHHFYEPMPTVEHFVEVMPGR
jgi:heme-degrading monooxygenase HmoA